MKLSKADFLMMRWNILAVCASALLGIAILYGSSRYAEHAQKDQYNAQRLMNEAQGRLTAARRNMGNMSVYSGEYGALEDAGIIGNEQRLDWLEGLEKLRRKNLVAGFRYQIAPQNDYTASTAIDRGNFHIRYSEMKLQFDLLHEVQLLDFFDALRSDIKGRYQLESCTLQRIAPGNVEGQTAPVQLKAECSGGWVTLNNRNAPR